MNYSKGKFVIIEQEIWADGNLCFTAINSDLSHKKAIEMAYELNLKNSGIREGQFGKSHLAYFVISRELLFNL